MDTQNTSTHIKHNPHKYNTPTFHTFQNIKNQLIVQWLMMMLTATSSPQVYYYYKTRNQFCHTIKPRFFFNPALLPLLTAHTHIHIPKKRYRQQATHIHTQRPPKSSEEQQVSWNARPTNFRQWCKQKKKKNCVCLFSSLTYIVYFLCKLYFLC